MNKRLCKIFGLAVSIIVIFGTIFAVPSQAAAQNDFSMKPLDKAYISFLFDDGRMPFSEECFKLFKRYEMPMCCNIVATDVMDNEDAIDLFTKVQNAGGEILSHTYSHNAITSETSNLNFIERQLGDSYRVLTGLGFNINGIIEAGNGGGESTANYELIETISRKYYKYSNAYGVSAQYDLDRNWLANMDLSTAKSKVDNAIKTKGWYTFWAHDFSEFSKSDMDQLLEYIEQKGKDKVEVVTWNYMYNTFGNYTGPQVPTKEALLSVCTTQGHDLKNGKVIKPATCVAGATMEGKCARCGETGTSVLKYGAKGHKFENYVSDNNADCYNMATKTAKCIYEGCKETDTVVDFDSDFKHKFETIVITEPTDDEEGLGEVTCSLCGRVEETVVIPALKDGEEDVSSKTTNKKEEATSSKSKNNKTEASSSKPKKETATSSKSNKEEAASSKTENKKEEVSSKLANETVDEVSSEFEEENEEDVSLEPENEETDWMEGITPEDEDGVEGSSKGEKSPNKTTIIVLIVVGVLLAAGIGVGIFFVVKKLRNKA